LLERIEIAGESKNTIDPLARDAMGITTLGETEKQKPHDLKDILGEKQDIKETQAPAPSGDFEVIDSYEGVQILRSPDEIIPIYSVVMPEIKKEDWKKITKFKDIILKESTFDPTKILDMTERKNAFAEEAKKIVNAADPSISKDKLDLYTELLTQSMIGYGLLDPPLSDDNLEEVMVIGENQKVYVAHRKHGMCSSNIVFPNDEEMVNIIDRMAREVGRKIDTLNPLLDARLKDGSRVNATIRPITPGGATLTIRKFRADPLTVIDLINYSTFSVDFAAWLWVAIDGLGVKPANAIVAGGTGSGKTTTLNSLATFIPERDRVITIEDTMELQLRPHKHWIQMETRPPNAEGVGKIDMDDCVINTLRMRPDRVIVGEVRGPEAKTMFVAMNTGHDGTLGTVHANDAKETVTRLTNPPMSVPLIMIPAMDLIVMQNRFKHPTKGNIRRITEVAEVAGMEENQVLMNRPFKYNSKTDHLEDTGTPSRLMADLAEKAGITGEEMNMEIAKRAMVVKWLVDNKMRSLEEVKNAIMEFNRDSDGFLSKIT
jgi:flagellar protein FlaI